MPKLPSSCSFAPSKIAGRDLRIDGKGREMGDDSGPVHALFYKLIEFSFIIVIRERMAKE